VVLPARDPGFATRGFTMAGSILMPLVGERGLGGIHRDVPCAISQTTKAVCCGSMSIGRSMTIADGRYGNGGDEGQWRHEKSTTEICIAGQATIQKSFSFA